MVDWLNHYRSQWWIAELIVCTVTTYTNNSQIRTIEQLSASNDRRIAYHDYARFKGTASRDVGPFFGRKNSSWAPNLYEQVKTFLFYLSFWQKTCVCTQSLTTLRGVVIHCTLTQCQQSRCLYEAMVVCWHSWYII